MARGESTASGGICLMGALFLVLLTLKLLGKITLSWLWVTAPLWCGLALVCAIFAWIGLFSLGAWILTKVFNR